MEDTETRSRAYNKNFAKRRRLLSRVTGQFEPSHRNSGIVECVDRLTKILSQQQQEKVLSQAMGDVIVVIRGLGLLWAYRTTDLRHDVKNMYIKALDYVRRVIDRLSKVDDSDVSEDTDDIDNSGPFQALFADAYQSLMELIAGYNRGDDRSIHLTRNLELKLLVLPIALSRHIHTGADSPLLPLLPLPPQLKSLASVSCISRSLFKIALRNVPTALALTASVQGTTADGLAEWLVVEFCRHLTQSARLEICSQSQSQLFSQPFEQCMQILEKTPVRFVRQYQDTIISELMVTGNKVALKHIAQILDIGLPVLCITHTASIFAKASLLDDQLMDATMQLFARLAATESDLQPGQIDVDTPIIVRPCSEKISFNLFLSLGSDDKVLRRRAQTALLIVRDIIHASGPEARNNVLAIVQVGTANVKSASVSDSPQRDSGSTGACRAVDMQLAKTMSEYVLDILACMNEILQDAYSTTTTSIRDSLKQHCNEKSQCQAIRAIGELVMILASETEPFVYNIVATLSPLLESPLAGIALESWSQLAESLNSVMLTASQLNSLIVPLLRTFLVSDGDVRSGAAHVVNRVVLIHEAAIKSSYVYVCPIPDYPLLSQSIVVLREIEAHSSLQQRLVQLTQMLRIKDAAIVVCAAHKMCLLLKHHARQVNDWKLALSSGSTDDASAGASSLIEAMHALQSACNAGGPLGDMAVANYVACLAVIGFINNQTLDMAASSLDAGRVAASCGHMESAPVLSDLSHTSEQREFACTLVSDHLVHMFTLALSPGIQSCAAFTIQELLHQVGFTKDTLVDGTDDTAASQSTRRIDKGKARDDGQQQSSAGAQTASSGDAAIRQRWEYLPLHVIEIIRPLLDSRYTPPPLPRLPSATSQQHDRTPCILRATSQVSWLRIWFTELIGLLGDAQVAPIFQVCTSAAKVGSADMLLFILPHLVYQHCLLLPQTSTKLSTPVHVVTADHRGSASKDVGREGSSNLKTATVIDLISQEILAVLSCKAGDVKMPNGQWRLCKEAVFGLLDSLNKCLRKMQGGYAEHKPSTRTTAMDAPLPPEEQALASLVESVPHSLIASAASACHQFARAIQHMELALRKDRPDRLPMLFQNADDSALATIQEHYLHMGDADGVAGIIACRKRIEGSTVEDRGTVHVHTSPVGNTAASFSALISQLLDKIRRNPNDIEQLVLPLPPSAYALSKAESGDEVTALDLVGSALQRIGCVFAESATSFNQLLSGARTLMDTSISPGLVHAHILGDINLLADHMSCASSSNGTPSISEITSLVEQWRARVACLPPIYSVQEPVLELHCTLYSMLLERICSDSNEMSSNHETAIVAILNRQLLLTRLQAAQLARLAGRWEAAQGILDDAKHISLISDIHLALLQTEHAQLQWDQGNTTDAMAEISRVVAMLSDTLGLTIDSEEAVQLTNTAGVNTSSYNITNPEQPSQDVMDLKSVFAKATLLLVQWQQETRSVSTQGLLDNLMQIQRVCTGDKVAFAIGQLYDTMYTTARENKPNNAGEIWDEWELRVASLRSNAIRKYASALTSNPQYIFKVLPRLLTIWLNVGATLVNPTNVRRSSLIAQLKSTNSTVRNLATDLPTYYFLIVLRQLLSHIDHPNAEVFDVMEYIVMRVLEKYPQQTLWHLIGVQRSTNTAQVDRCNEILDKARAMHRMGVGSAVSHGGGCGIASLISQFSKVAYSLSRLCNATTPSRSVTAMHIPKDFPDLAGCKSMNIIIPLQSSLTPALPDISRSDTEYELALSSIPTGAASSRVQTALQRAMQHRPFPDNLPMISGFADKVTVMDSMQKPKRIEILGSDGCSYPFLCKSKDDLRKDACVMRLNTMINHLMQANRQTRERNLHIRTYAVVPLNEECGLIQWVGSTTGIRSILMNQFKKRNVKIHVNDIKRILAKTSPSPQEIFTKELLPKYPSVMHEWFMESFPNPGEWLLNRTAFTRTAAVMSMIGYIIGLGDRHCVNILLDEKTGDVVHVDFDCLFNQGLLQEKPEVVPFRLTRNMVDAMGVTGYEGTFRKTCEMTLRLLCEHRDALMSVLEPLVHDLLVEWIRRSYPGNMSLEPIRELASMNDHAKKILDTLRKKLQGKLHGETQLSVEEQVDELIREATDPGRLFQMFIGWAAYL